MKKIYYILILLPMVFFGQTPTENYIKTKTYKTATTTSIATPTSAQAVESITYFDGLGRPIQQIAHKQSATGKNIVTHIEYDALGRQVKEYLPYCKWYGTPNLDYTSAALSETIAYYSTYDTIVTGNPNFDRTSNPYSEKLFENSPLNRVLELAAPGNDWSLNTSIKHTVRTDYQTNITNEVKLFKASTTWNASSGIYDIGFINNNTFYPENKLYKTITKNENWKTGDGFNNTTEEFKDQEGHVVMKRTYGASIVNNIETPVWHETYYVYDDYGNLTFVLPPKVDGAITTTILNELCYQYKYDHRNRLVEKKLPGKDYWEFIVYDKLDRIVATGPVLSPFNDLTASGWMITKYDAFNRIIYTGWENTAVNAATRTLKQATYDGFTAFNENKLSSAVNIDGVSVNYSNAVGTTAFKLLSVNYYDDYITGLTFNPALSYTSSVTPQPVCYNNTAGTLPKGLATVSWTRVPETYNTTPIKAEMNYTLYDKKGRVVRTFSNNYLGGFTQVDSQLEDISGRLNYTLTTHKRLASDNVLIVREDFTYSVEDRLLTHTHSINGATPELLSENTYDELGQLISKKVGKNSSAPLQKVDYKYNIRGWLTAINDVADLKPTTENDLFAFKINYNTVEDIQPYYSGTKLYNGNISETYWRSNNDNILRKYGYKYDNLNRLRDAIYQKPESSVVVTNSYNENLTYDKNGNIMTMQRNGDFDDPITPLQIDNLTYIYDNSNSTNRLIKVTDSTNSTLGFKDGANTASEYGYDNNGNMIRDDNKGISQIKYNNLNLPVEITFTGTPVKKINYLYTSDGKKLGKIVTNGSIITTSDYFDKFQYIKANAAAAVKLDFISHDEGYIVSVVDDNNVTNYNYVFNYKDHLGNIRMTYTFEVAINALTILEENNYYPFGLKHTKYNIDQLYYDSCGGKCIIKVKRSPYQYKYNGKEFQDELGLNMYDYGARNYDPALGRWMNIDPLAEKSRRFSPYVYALDNPVYFIDPDGMRAAPPDWFVNNKTGAVVFVKGESQLTQKQSDAIGAGDAKNYDRLGPDEMFGAKVPYGTGNILDMEAYNVENPEGFMNDQGYEKAEKVRIKESEMTSGGRMGEENITHVIPDLIQLGDSKVTYERTSGLNSKEIVSETNASGTYSSSKSITYNLIKPFGQDNRATAEYYTNRSSNANIGKYATFTDNLMKVLNAIMIAIQK